MIPLLYRLRDGVRFERRQESYLAVSQTPLGVVRVSPRGADILRACNGETTIDRIATAVGADIEEVFRLCEYFNSNGFLEVAGSHGNGRLPSVSVIIPTKDSCDALRECLESVFSQDYPRDRIEVIVIDDGSRDATRAVVRDFPCKVLSNPRSRGPAYCRNAGARESSAEVVAFLDSDCVAGEKWLSDIAPFFESDRVGAVGGYVDGYYMQSALDRYEQVFSPLNMGKHVYRGTNDESTLYAPTCNLLVRRSIFLEIGGFREEMHVGEDVDLCWRMRRKGSDILYVPFGSVGHKHRNRFWKMLKRRADYGTSEAILYELHPEKKKVLQLPAMAAAGLAALLWAIIGRSLLPCLLTLGCIVFDALLKESRLGKFGIQISRARVLFSVVRTHFSFFYFMSFHVVRYYTVVLMIAGTFYHPIWLVCAAMLMTTSLVDYTTRRPRVNFATFFFYYAFEHVAYQLGVFAGCVRQGTFGSYVPRLRTRRRV